MTPLVRRALARAFLVLASMAMLAAPAGAQFGFQPPTGPATAPCSPFTGFPLSLNLGQRSDGLDGISSRCGFQRMQDGVNAIAGSRAQPGGIATLDSNGLIPLAQIPAYGFLPSTVPSLTISGPGSSGPVDGMSATPSATAAVGTLSRSMFEALRGSIFYVRPYLNGPDGKTDLACAFDQTANMNTAIAAAPAGAQLLLPPGCIAISGTLTNTSQRWTGTGSIGGTEIRYTGSTGNAIQLMGDNATVEGLRVNNEGASTSSQGIVLADGLTNPIRQRVHDVYVTGFTNGIDVESGYLWSMDHVEVRNFTNYGAVIRNKVYCDNGDWSLLNFTARNDFTPQPGSAGIRYESGGGGKIVNSKILGSQFGIDLALQDSCRNPPQTAIGSTGDLNVSNTSLENQSVIGIRLAGGATARFGSVALTGNELAGQPTAIGVYSGVYNVNINGNVLTAVNYGTQVFGGDVINISGNTYGQTGVAAVDLHDGVTNLNVGPNTYSPLALGSHTVLDQRTSDTGPVYYSARRKLSLSQSANYTPVYELDTGTFRSAKVEITVEGQVSSLGSVAHHISALLSNNAGTVTVTSLIDKNSTNPVDINLDTTTTPNSVIIGVRPNAAAGGGNLIGSVSIKADGMLVGFKPLI